MKRRYGTQIGELPMLEDSVSTPGRHHLSGYRSTEIRPRSRWGWGGVVESGSGTSSGYGWPRVLQRQICLTDP